MVNIRMVAAVSFAVALVATLTMCRNRLGPEFDRPVSPELAADGKTIFRFDTFGNEVFWTDTLRLHEVIQQGVSPTTALSVGLKVDLDALPQAVRDAIAAGAVDLDDPATTLTLLSLNAVVGLQGDVQNIGGQDTLVSVGITCAFCHSTVDDAFAPGIGRRLDGWPNRDLNVGAIVALSPALTDAQRTVYSSWGPGRYDARYNIDGQNAPVVLPPAFGLRTVRNETYTGDDTLSYWNAYVAVTQMHGQGTFVDARLGIDIAHTPDLVTPKLPALRDYQHSLAAPTPSTANFDVEAAARGREVFSGAGACATCHMPERAYSDINAGELHEPAATGMEPVAASRSVTGRYRTTPLRGLWSPPWLQGPYFHDGSAATLADVVAHYNEVRNLNLTAAQQADLVEFLKSL